MPSRIELAQEYARTGDEVLLSELHKLIMADIDAGISGFPKDGTLEDQALALSAIVYDAAKLTPDLNELIITRLSGEGILGKREARARIDAARDGEVEVVPVEDLPPPGGNGRSSKNRNDGMMLAADAPEAGAPPSGPPGGVDQPFHCLGYNSGEYYYLPKGARQVFSMSPTDHKKNNFLHLAPLPYWNRVYPGMNDKPDWDDAANSLLQQCQVRGVYDSTRVRGRGAWWDADAGCAVLHLGDRILRGNEVIPIEDYPVGRWIYQTAPAMDTSDHEGQTDPLTAEESTRLVDLLEMISWEKPVSSKFLAGWLALAPICGALSWRPHVWVTGPSGCGKSILSDSVIHKVLGPIALLAGSVTTEAGIRQMIGHDARPVVFDEAEGQNERQKFRMENVIVLVRQASSETGASIIKGTASGEAISYRVRSCFCFASINDSLQQGADTSRVTILNMNMPDPTTGPAQYAAFQKARDSLLTQEWIARFHARIVNMIPTIRENARIFAAAAAHSDVLGSQRAGDQMGTLLGGVYALFDDNAVTPEFAQEWIAKHDWSEQRQAKETSDEHACYQRILQHVVTVRDSHVAKDKSISELISISLGREVDTHVAACDAEAVLQRHGIRCLPYGKGRLEAAPEPRYGDDGPYDYDGARIVIANTHGAVEKMLMNTPWAQGWSRILKRLPLARPSTHAVRFAGVQCRGVVIPFTDEKSETEFPFGDKSKPGAG